MLDMVKQAPRSKGKASRSKAKEYAVLPDTGIRQSRGKAKASAQKTTRWPPMWQELIRSVGSYQTLAELWGISHMTVYRWGAMGVEPSVLEKMGIREFCRLRNVPSPV